MFTNEQLTTCHVIESGFLNNREFLSKELAYVDGEITGSFSMDDVENMSEEDNLSTMLSNADILIIKLLGSSSEVLEKVELLNEKSIPGTIHVILYAPEADHELIAQCADFNIFAVLIEHTPPEVLTSIVKSCYSSICLVNKLKKEVIERRSAIGGIRAGHFEIRTPNEAYNLATMLSVTSPDPKTLSGGLFELMSNAIEHGNLEIGYDLKTDLLNQSKYYQEIENRLNSDNYRDKKVTILFNRDDKKITFTIKDEGKGFNPKPFMSFDPKRMLDAHGRGIAMTVASNFSSVKYNEIGNEVTCELEIN